MLTLKNPHNQALQVHQGGRFIEKIFTDQSGQQFKLVFFVALVNGEVKGTLISAQPVGSVDVGATCAYLPISLSINKVVTEYVPTYASVVSPFNKFFFFTSQPTRAPSL